MEFNVLIQRRRSLFSVRRFPFNRTSRKGHKIGHGAWCAVFAQFGFDIASAGYKARHEGAFAFDIHCWGWGIRMTRLHSPRRGQRQPL